MMKRELLIAGIPLAVLLLGEGGPFQGPHHSDADYHYDSTARAIREWLAPSSEVGETGDLVLFFTR
ncbi:MAG: hypothetical protein JSV35_00460 [Candidatus Bathyarchaeota archaeon]|nr:MAG: hypothetical protein JSV35_00460 [Candidatus Bathyarchaeota archaeon]